MKEWRPRLKHGQVTIRRQGRLFALVCRTQHEADYLERAVVSAVIRFRKKE
jgi:hypothetical protein